MVLPAASDCGSRLFGSLSQAPAALGGATAFGVLRRFAASTPLAVALGFATTVGIRGVGVLKNVKLPTYDKTVGAALPAPRLDRADAHLVVTCWGRDRLGHVAALAEVLAAARANISASKVATIGDDIASARVVPRRPRESHRVASPRPRPRRSSCSWCRRRARRETTSCRA